MKKNNILYPQQFGFRCKHSTSDGIMNLVGEILSALDKKSMLLSIFVDLRKAFDTVSYSVILAKLSKLGIMNKELNWFTSYLTGRSQYVCAENSKSERQVIANGVTKGSLLGVLLFPLIINDLPKITQICYQHSLC